MWNNPDINTSRLASFIFLMVLLSVLFVTGLSAAPGRLVVDTWTLCSDPPENLGPDGIPHGCDWQDIDLASLFTAPPPWEKKMRYMWLKAEVALEHPGAYYGISLGRIYLADTVYINGVYCGEHGRGGVQEFHFPRNYIIPGRTLVKGANEILVCLGTYGREFGGIRDTVALVSKSVFNRNLLLDNLFFFQVPLGVILMFAGMFIMIILSYNIRKMGPAIWLLLGILGVWLTHLSVIFSPFQPFGLEFRINYLWICFFINSALFMLVVQYAQSYFFNRLNRAVLPIIALCAVMTMIFNDTTAAYYPGRILGFGVLILINVVMIYMFIRIRQVKPDSSIYLFWIFGFIPVSAIGIDVVNYLYGTHTPPFYHVYMIPAVNILVALLQRKRFKRHRTKFRQLIEALNEYGQDPELDPSAPPSVSPPLEKKLEDIRAYIDDHCTSPMSRESLAERSGLSPDYMSRMFNTYFGVKINQYINDRRIDKACTLLNETDDKIVDIAFSVGFESLATFSRAFAKKHKVSPTEYRIRKRIFRD